MPRKKKSQDTALDLVDQLLKNDGVKEKPKKKRGRPKGSKNKPKSKVKTPKPVAETQKGSKKKKGEAAIFRLQYVSPEAYLELGEPAFGYTTARIKQYNNKCHGYYEIYLEYVRAAILWSKLAKTIDWYTNLSEHHLSLCRREIEDFRVANGLTKHDFWEVIAISHRFGHSRKKMVKELRSLAKIVLEYRRDKIEDEKEKEKVLFREVAKIPKNIPPVLNHVVIQTVTVEGEVRSAIADLTDNPQVQNEHACPEHLNYRGLRKPRNGCPTCFYFWKHNKKLGLKEKRNR
jgi:hypothetical protein